MHPKANGRRRTVGGMGRTDLAARINRLQHSMTKHMQVLRAVGAVSQPQRVASQARVRKNPMLQLCLSGCLPIKVGRRCRATLILGPRSNAALPEWSFVNQPDKQGCNV